MNPTVKQLWTGALLSGKYKQGTDALKRSVDWTDKPLHCCLGVLCEIAVEQGVDISVEAPVESGYAADWLFEGDVEALPDKVRKWAGIETHLGKLPEDYKYNDQQFESLAEMNDSGLSFKAIASVIEEVF